MQQLTALYLEHVRSQMTEHVMVGQTGVRQVVLASQDRRGGHDGHSTSLCVLVSIPTPEQPRCTISDNGYVAAVVGAEFLLGEEAAELLDWHAVEADATTARLLAYVDDPAHLGQRMHDMEQAMLDMLRYSRGWLRSPARVTAGAAPLR